MPTWLRAARAAAGLAAPTGTGMPSAPRRNVAMSAGQARRADGTRPLTGLHRTPPLRPAAYEPPRTDAATIAEVRRVAQQRLLLLPRLHTKTAQRRAADEGELGVSVVYCKRKRNILWNVRVFRGIIEALKQQPRPI